MNLSNRKRRSSLVMVFILGAVLIILIIAIGLGSGGETSSPLQSDSISIPPPLEIADFPEETISYPTDWPKELIFPNEFLLVDTVSGTSPGNTTQGWGARLRFEGTPPDALQQTSKFLRQMDWNITENYPLDSGGFILLIQKDEGDGIVILDLDPTDKTQTLIQTTIFP